MNIKAFGENLYFAHMEKHIFGKILICGGDTDLVGEDAFEALCVSNKEKEFFMSNFLCGTTHPMLLLGRDKTVLVDRRLLYTHGICCFVPISYNTSAICGMFCEGVLGDCLCSDGVCAAAKQKTHQNGLRDIYIEMARLTECLSVFDDSISIENIYGVADRVAYLTGCHIQYLGIESGTDIYPRGRLYSNSTLAFAVTAMAMSAIRKTQSTCVYLRRIGENIEVRTGGRCKEYTSAVSYLKYISELRGTEINICSGEEEACLNICPFYTDIGLVGVKTYLNFGF